MINNVNNGKYDSYNDFVKTKKENQSNPRSKFCSKTKHKLTFLSVIVTKPVEILFDQIIDNIKRLIKNYVTP